MSGYFRPGSSWLHRRNPITKLLGLIWAVVAVFLLPPPAIAGLLVLVASVAWSAGQLRPLVGALRIPAVLLASILFINAFFYPGATDIIVPLGPIGLSGTGIAFGLSAAGRVLVAFCASILFLFTTLADDLLESLVIRGASPRIAYVILSAMQTVPRLQATARSILIAQQTRGLSVTGSPFRRFRTLVPLVGPILLGALIDVRERTFALEARGFGAGTRRTAYRVVRDPPVDRWLRRLTLVGIVSVVVLAVVGGRAAS